MDERHRFNLLHVPVFASSVGNYGHEVLLSPIGVSNVGTSSSERDFVDLVGGGERFREYEWN